MHMLTMFGHYDTLPTNQQFVICGQSAVKVHGLTTTRPKFHVYATKPLPYNDPEVNIHIIDSFDEIGWTMKNNRPVTTVLQTAIDIYGKRMKFDPQIFYEMIIKLHDKYHDVFLQLADMLTDEALERYKYYCDEYIYTEDYVYV